MTSARIVKAQIEKTHLGEISEYIKEVHRSDMSYISIKLDMHAINNLHLNVDATVVRAAILGSYGATKSTILRALDAKHIVTLGRYNDRLRVFPPALVGKQQRNGVPTHQRLYFNIQALKNALPGVNIRGIPSGKNQPLDPFTD